jgi:hypothetical protein
MLDAFAPYKWPLIGVAVALLGYGFYRAYIRPRRTCAPHAVCEVRGTSRDARIGLWIALLLTVGGIVLERLEPSLVSH